MARITFKGWLRSGSPWIWLNAAAVSVSLIAVIGLLSIIAVSGLRYFWPSQVVAFTYEDNAQPVRVIGEIYDTEVVPASQLIQAGFKLADETADVTRYLIRMGNRDSNPPDFGWVIEPMMSDRQYPDHLAVIERLEWGNAYGVIEQVKQNGQVLAAGQDVMGALQPLLERAQTLHADIKDIESGEISSINYGLERLRLKEKGWVLKQALTPEKQQKLAQQRATLQQEYAQLESRLVALRQDIQRDALVLKISNGQAVEVPLAKVVRIYHPNQMSWLQKIGLYFERMWEFLSADPREANTEGGIFPAIFGTVMMVILMSILVTPLGVIAAVYLREYAKQGLLTRMIRIAVNNLAGVPSIVYGVFGLGFFVYFMGGSIDRIFFPEALPSPTVGTPGLLWASLTLAILTVPVVIVATEEGLSRVPLALREGSLALGATKAETLWRVILPMTSPAMMTGLILAVARAAGEVAPLMLVGVVKLAPTLPLDGDFPFLHLDRKFMHLGFHIFDVGFQSPNVEAARPLVFATAFLLVLVIVVLNLASIVIRNNLREKYRSVGS